MSKPTGISPLKSVYHLKTADNYAKDGNWESARDHMDLANAINMHIIARKLGKVSTSLEILAALAKVGE